MGREGSSADTTEGMDGMGKMDQRCLCLLWALWCLLQGEAQSTGRHPQEAAGASKLCSCHHSSQEKQLPALGTLIGLPSKITLMSPRCKHFSGWHVKAFPVFIQLHSPPDPSEPLTLSPLGDPRSPAPPGMSATPGCLALLHRHIDALRDACPASSQPQHPVSSPRLVILPKFPSFV